ncbi:hypothetical protein AVEN_94956-1 [Araneus ventricosus]|uniref:FDX-ACB domain-containing protein n=1 Tax=Araneus ventricosus TaxID=182803 RepID=A0A4Y2DIG1_ARAVE|nr:hypothetical protein AVEN_94956-1 [Araneus ventricosus]
MEDRRGIRIYPGTVHLDDPSVKNVLFVGDSGDCPTVLLAEAYMQYVKNSKASESITITLPERYSFQNVHSHIIKILKLCGARVSTGVNFMQLEKHPAVRKHKYTKIFYLPNVLIQYNPESSDILRKFILSAKKVLKKGGKIYITLTREPSDTDAQDYQKMTQNNWNLVEVAENIGLRLCEAIPYFFYLFDECQLKMNRKNKAIYKRVHGSKLVTHIFQNSKNILPRKIQQRISTILNDVQQDNFYKGIKDLYKSLSYKKEIPYTKLVQAFDAVARRNFASLDSIFVKDLLNCENSTLPCHCISHIEENVDSHTSELCHQSTLAIISQFLNFKTDNYHSVTSMLFCVHCPHFFRAHFYPFVHILSYFSSSWESVVKGLKAIVKDMGKDIPGNTPDFCWNDIPCRLKTQELSADPCQHSVTLTELTNVIYFRCEILEAACHDFYMNATVIIQRGSDPAPPLVPAAKIFEVGRIMKFTYFKESYYVTLLNLEMISCAKFHIMDCRILLLKDSRFFKKGKYQQRFVNSFGDVPKLAYRSVRLYPPVHIHDESFLIVNDAFLEMTLFMLVWNVAADFMKSLKLIDAQINEVTEREIRTYRFSYGSDEKTLSSRNARKIHKSVVKAIETHLQVLKLKRTIRVSRNISETSSGSSIQ